MLNSPVNNDKQVSGATNTVTNNEEAVKPVMQETKNLDSVAQNNQKIDQFYQEQNDKNWGLVDIVF